MTKRRTLQERIDNPLNEADLQVSIVHWFRKAYPRVLSCRTKGEVNISNTAMRNSVIREDYNMGYRTGWPDFQIVKKVEVTNKLGVKTQYGSLFIEFKSPTGNGRLSIEQKQVAVELKEAGFCWITVNQVEQAKRLIRTYLSAQSIADEQEKMDLIMEKETKKKQKQPRQKQSKEKTTGKRKEVVHELPLPKKTKTLVKKVIPPNYSSSEEVHSEIDDSLDVSDIEVVNISD